MKTTTVAVDFLGAYNVGMPLKDIFESHAKAKASTAPVQDGGFGVEVLKARQEMGITQEQLRDISGVSQTIISKLENDQRAGVNDATLVRLCAALGIRDGEVGTLADFIRSRTGATLNSDELSHLIALRASKDTWRNASQDAWVLALGTVRALLYSGLK